MQNIDLICLGKLNARYCAEGVAEYARRLSAFRLAFRFFSSSSRDTRLITGFAR